VSGSSSLSSYYGAQGVKGFDDDDNDDYDDYVNCTVNIEMVFFHWPNIANSK
jgi:hypothetical protein